MDKRRITSLRQRFEWSQDELSKALGVASRKTISHWETGTRKPSAPIERFLVFLERLPDSDFRKAAELLMKIARHEK